MKAAFLLVLLAAAMPAVRLPVRAYTTADGLPSNDINCVVPDSRGFLWLCTPEGLARFDGYQFETYGVAQGLPHPYVNAFLETRTGRMLAGTGGGLAVFKSRTPETGANRFDVYHPAPAPKESDIQSLFEDRGGRIWCGTSAGLFEVRWGTAGPVFERRIGNAAIAGIAQDAAGSLWLAAYERSIFQITTAGEVRHYSSFPGVHGEWSHAIATDREGAIWAGIGDSLCKLRRAPAADGSIIERTFGPREGLGKARWWVEGIYAARSGHLWVAGSDGGAFEYTRDVRRPFLRFRAAEGIADSGVTTFGEDFAGNLWVGADFTGARRIARDGMKSYGDADGLPPGVVSVAESGAAIFAVSRQRNQRVRLSRFDGERFTTIDPAFPRNIHWYGWGTGSLAFQDRTGDWWIPTGEGLYRFDGGLRGAPKAVYTTRDGLASNDIFGLLEDAAGDVWIATTAPTGLSRWERSTGRFHRYQDMPREGEITALARQPQADVWAGVWVGTTAGLFRSHGDRLERIDTPGVPPNGASALHIDRAGRLWAGNRFGLFRCDNPAAAHPSFQSVFTEAVQRLTEDRWGRIYACTSRGVVRLDPATGLRRLYTTADGLANPGFNAAYADSRGDLWFALGEGVSRLTPRLDPPRPPAPVYFTAIRASGRAVPLDPQGQAAVPNISLRPYENSLEVDFVGIEMGTGRSLQYQYQLEGSDREWQPLAGRRTIHFASLSPGNYRLLVRAVNSDGLATSPPASVGLLVATPLWRRSWALLLEASMLAALAYLAHRLRLRHFLELERVRARIATDLHDDIGASLSQIAILSEVARAGRQTPEPADRHLSHIATLSRELIDSMSDIVWSVNPERDRLAELTHHMRHFAADLLSARNIEFDFRGPEDDWKMDANIRREVFLVFKEAVNNLARHSGCTRARIEFAIEGRVLSLRVADNGKGMPAASTGGNGLASMRRRAGALGGVLVIESTERGTEVWLRVYIRSYLNRW